jgi:hypothetical protein
MNIYEIKEKTKDTEPYFFSKKTMKFFNQTLKDFKVKKQKDGRFKISADSWPVNSDLYGNKTIRFFNPENNKLELK